jgi:hypothetical protein
MDTFERSVVATILDASGVALAGVEEDVQRFVRDGVRAMPIHLRAGVRTLERFLGARALARHGRPFAALDTGQRASELRAWGRSRLDPVRQYVRLVRSLTLFAAYERRSSTPAS